MKVDLSVLAAAAASAFFWTEGSRAADGVWTNAATGNWGDASRWSGGIVAGAGGTAAFKAASGSINVTNNVGTVTLSGLSANPEAGNAAAWSIIGGTNEMVSPAFIYTRADSLSVRYGTLSGSTDITVTGLGRFYLGDDNLYSGRTIISNGNVRVARDTGFGPVPAAVQADAIILDNGGLENDDSNFILNTHSNRGITVTSRGGFVGAGYTAAGMVINGPVTGPGLLGINFENCAVTLNNSGNDYSGGTVVGTNGPGANTACAPFLKLGQNEVLPHGVGKGGLKIGVDSISNLALPVSTLDLNGKAETVNTLLSGPRAAITSSVANQGRLIVGGLDEDSDYRGTMAGGATVEKQGAGTLRLAEAYLSGGTVDAKAGTVLASGPNFAWGSTVLLNGGWLQLAAPAGAYAGYENVLGARLLLGQNSTLTLAEDARLTVFGGILSTNVAADPEPVLTVDNGGLPLLFGSAGAYPAVLDAAVATTGGLVLTNRVWLRRLPSESYSIAGGAELALDGAALLGGTELNLTTYSVRVVRPDSVGGDGSVTANANTAVWFDTMRFAGNALSDSAATAAAYANNVALNGGKVRFTGAGAVTYSGAITGAGTAVKDGAGDLLLTGTASSFSGEIQINAGRLLPANEAALGGATVRVNGGRLTNPAGGNLTLAATPVIAQSGGFEATAAGETLAINSRITGAGPVSKWGGGKLSLGGTEANTGLQLYARAGVVELAKSGAADSYAVQHLLGIQSNAVVKLAGPNGNQIGGNVALDGGTLDLNGLSETIGALTNTAASGTVTNSGAQAATLTVGEGGVSSLFSGRLRDGASPLLFAKTGLGTLTLLAESVGYTGGTRVEGGTLRIQRESSTTAQFLRFFPLGTRTNAQYSGTGYQFSEFQVMLNGVGVTNPAGTTAYAAVPASGGEMAPKTVNGSLSDKWYCSVYGNPLIITFGQPVTFNSYRWATANDAPGRDPVTWTLEMGVVGAGVTNWYLLDAQTNYYPTTTRNAWIGTNFVVYTPFNNVIPDNHPVNVAAGARLALSNLKETIENLSGNGTLLLENSSAVTLTDVNAFTGTVAGTGTLILKTAGEASPSFTVRDNGITVRNDGSADSTFLYNTSATNQFCGSIQDGAKMLGVEQSGPGITYFSGTNSTYTGATRILAGQAIVNGASSAKYVRFSPSLMRSGSTFDYQISDFDLMFNGQRIPYPVGTTASTPNPLFNNFSEGPTNALDGNVNTKFYSSVSPVSALVIALPEMVFFDAYRWYTANDMSGRDPSNWVVEASVDGVNWTVVDSRSNQTVTTARFALAGVYGVASVSNMNVFSDLSLTAVAAPGVLGVSRTSETIGPLSSNGTVRLTAGAMLGINAFTNAAFSGGFSGTGTVVKAGAATQALSGALSFSGTLIVENGILDLSGAVLTGVTNIVLKAGGTLTGAATVNGDLTVTFEGGWYSASLTVSGALTVAGTVRLAVPPGATYPYYNTLFRYASADAATRNALANAIKPSPVPSGYAATLRVTETAAQLVIAPVGTVLSIR